MVKGARRGRVDVLAGAGAVRGTLFRWGTGKPPMRVAGVGAQGAGEVVAFEVASLIKELRNV